MTDEKKPETGGCDQCSFTYGIIEGEKVKSIHPNRHVKGIPSPCHHQRKPEPPEETPHE